MSTLFIIGCLLCIVAVSVTIMLSPRPVGWVCHLRGLGRLMVLAGALFCLVRTLATSWVPPWEVVVYVGGIGLLSALYVREQWRAAAEKERAGVA